MIKLTGLPHFLAASETRNFTGAARVLGVSQPALTQAISKLERQLGVELFDRSSRPITLTHYGEVLVDYALRIEENNDELIARLAAIKAGTGGQLRVGCGPDWIHEILPEAIASLQSERPGLRVNLTVALNDDLRRRLDAGEIDLYFASISDVNFGSAYDAHVLLREPMLVIARADHPSMDGTAKSLEELAEESWVMTGGETFGRQLIKRLYGRSGVPAPTPVIETNSVRAMINILRKSHYLGFLSLTHTNAYPDIAAVPTDFEMPVREGGVIWRRDAPLTPAAEELLGRVRKLCATQAVPTV